MALTRLLLSFKGRIARRPYILVAAPILLIIASTPLWSGAPLMRLMERLGYSLTTFGPPLVAVLLASELLRLPLLAVSFKRLHDLDRSGLWALPYLIPPVYAAVATAAVMLGHAVARDVEWLGLLLTANFYYGIILALALAVLPGKSAPSDQT